MLREVEYAVLFRFVCGRFQEEGWSVLSALKVNMIGVDLTGEIFFKHYVDLQVESVDLG